MTKAGTPKALRIRRRRSLRTTRPGKPRWRAGRARRDRTAVSLIGASHVPSHRQLDPARRKLLRGLDVPDVQLEQLPLWRRLPQCGRRASRSAPCRSASSRTSLGFPARTETASPCGARRRTSSDERSPALGEERHLARLGRARPSLGRNVTFTAVRCSSNVGSTTSTPTRFSCRRLAPGDEMRNDQLLQRRPAVGERLLGLEEGQARAAPRRGRLSSHAKGRRMSGRSARPARGRSAPSGPGTSPCRRGPRSGACSRRAG